MNIRSVKYNNINEMMHIYEAENGLKVFCIPKKGYSKKHVAIGVNYGSMNNAFVLEEEKEIIKTPDGMAHFIEHMVFEQEVQNIIKKLSNLGSTFNAYTSFNQTVYRLSCSENLVESLDVLINHLYNSDFFTDENIRKEKKIITQEIKMHADNPNWRVFLNLLNALYKNNSIKIDIPGTVESIAEITKDMLYKCYNVFYHPSNMVILIVGDVDYLEIFSKISNITSHYPIKSTPTYKNIFLTEPEEINKAFIEDRLAISTNLFKIGFKDNHFEGRGLASIKEEAGMKILLEMIFGKSSQLYKTLYEKGLINNSFSFDYFIEPTHAFSVLGGTSPNPEVVKQMVVDEITRVKNSGLIYEDFYRIKRKKHGEFIKIFNSTDKIHEVFIPAYFKDTSIFNYLDIYEEITFENILDFLDQKFNMKNMALSKVTSI